MKKSEGDDENIRDLYRAGMGTLSDSSWSERLLFFLVAIGIWFQYPWLAIGAAVGVVLLILIATRLQKKDKIAQAALRELRVQVRKTKNDKR